MAQQDEAVAVDDEGAGEDGAEVAVGEGRAIGQGELIEFLAARSGVGQGQVEFLRLYEAAGAGVVLAGLEEDEADALFLGERTGERLQFRQFAPARRAPASPEVQDDDFAAQVRQAYRLAVGGFPGEIRKALAVCGAQWALAGGGGIGVGAPELRPGTAVEDLAPVDLVEDAGLVGVFPAQGERRVASGFGGGFVALPGPGAAGGDGKGAVLAGFEKGPIGGLPAVIKLWRAVLAGPERWAQGGEPSQQKTAGAQGAYVRAPLSALLPSP